MAVRVALILSVLAFAWGMIFGTNSASQAAGADIGRGLDMSFRFALFLMVVSGLQLSMIAGAVSLVLEVLFSERMRSLHFHSLLACIVGGVGLVYTMVFAPGLSVLAQLRELMLEAFVAVLASLTARALIRAKASETPDSASA